MAFTATIRNVQYWGPGRTSVSGEWAGSVGDAAGTMTISGTVIQAIFQKFNSDNTFQIIPRVTTTVANGISTITIENSDNVTTGYFELSKLG